MSLCDIEIVHCQHVKLHIRPKTATASETNPYLFFTCDCLDEPKIRTSLFCQDILTDRKCWYKCRYNQEHGHFCTYDYATKTLNCCCTKDTVIHVEEIEKVYCEHDSLHVRLFMPITEKDPVDTYDFYTCPCLQQPHATALDLYRVNNGIPWLPCLANGEPHKIYKSVFKTAYCPNGRIHGTYVSYDFEKNLIRCTCTK